MPGAVQKAAAQPGARLDAVTRGLAEGLFAYDLSRVRLHADSHSHEAAQALDADAFTVGSDIFFASGQFDPASPRGATLLTHELAHVVEQAARTDASGAQVLRAPRRHGSPEPIHPEAMDFLESKMRQLFELLSPTERLRLKRNSTIALGLATVDGEPRLVYTVAGNRTSPGLAAAADKLDLVRWTYDSGVKGRGGVGAPNDAEQLLSGFAEDNAAPLHGAVISRRVCADCGAVLAGSTHAGVVVRVVEDPITSRGFPDVPLTQPPARTASGEITLGPRSLSASAGARRATEGSPARLPRLPFRAVGGLVGGVLAAVALGKLQQSGIEKLDAIAFEHAMRRLQPAIDQRIEAAQGAASEHFAMWPDRPMFLALPLRVTYFTHTIAEAGEIYAMTGLIDVGIAPGPTPIYRFPIEIPPDLVDVGLRGEQVIEIVLPIPIEFDVKSPEERDALLAAVQSQREEFARRYEESQRPLVHIQIAPREDPLHTTP